MKTYYFYYRGDHIVPSMDEAFPKKKAEEVKTNVRFQGWDSPRVVSIGLFKFCFVSFLYNGV